MAPSTATQLKEEGNVLFAKREFVGAYDKYTEAIAIDGQNAVLYANRSACSFGMSKCQDAVLDATQATKIDPGYAKGWSRLAAAHNGMMDFENAVLACQKALDALPKANLSPSDLKQQKQYTEELKNTKLRLAAAEARAMAPHVVHVPAGGAKMPWQIAAEMLPELHAAGPARYSSSVYLVYHANQEFEQGLVYLNMLKRIPLPDTPEGYGMHGHTDGLTCLTNAIIRDRRVFRTNFPNWLSKFSDQANFETQKQQAWTNEDVDTIKKSALERLKRRGWSDVRPALAVTIRARILGAVFRSHLDKSPEGGIKDLEDVIELLVWGRRVWRLEPKDNRGAIFEDTFVVGVKALYIETLLSAHGKATGANRKALLDTILKVSQELIDEVGKVAPPSGPVDPGFCSSFRLYPEAEAHAAVGYCHLQIAQSCSNPTEKRAQYLLAAKQYGEAARIFPEDEEMHCWYLNCMLGPMLHVGEPKVRVMAIASAIRTAMPKMQKIWGNSLLARQGRDMIIEKTLRLVDEL